MSRTLYVVPTPIGNLEDITLRALRTLKEVGLIAAEDTRHSRILLTHFGIKTRVVSYHQHTKRSGVASILESLGTVDVALISDAGMPSLADPGFELIQAAISQGFRVEVLPGPSAVTTAVTLAAVPARGFIFMGFIPRNRKEAVVRLQEAGQLPYSLVIFESPNRIGTTLDILVSALGNRQIVATRELSKLHEEVIRGGAQELLSRLHGRELRGEWTLVIAPDVSPKSKPSDDVIFHAIARLQEQGETGRDAIRIVAQSFGVPRSEVYRVSLTTTHELQEIRSRA